MNRIYGAYCLNNTGSRITDQSTQIVVGYQASDLDGSGPSTVFGYRIGGGPWVEETHATEVISSTFNVGLLASGTEVFYKATIETSNSTDTVYGKTTVGHVEPSLIPDQIVVQQIKRLSGGPTTWIVGQVLDANEFPLSNCVVRWGKTGAADLTFNALLTNESGRFVIDNEQARMLVADSASQSWTFKTPKWRPDLEVDYDESGADYISTTLVVDCERPATIDSFDVESSGSDTYYADSSTDKNIVLACSTYVDSDPLHTRLKFDLSSFDDWPRPVVRVWIDLVCQTAHIGGSRTAWISVHPVVSGTIDTTICDTCEIPIVEGARLTIPCDACFNYLFDRSDSTSITLAVSMRSPVDSDDSPNSGIDLPFDRSWIACYGIEHATYKPSLNIAVWDEADHYGDDYEDLLTIDNIDIVPAMTDEVDYHYFSAGVDDHPIVEHSEAIAQVPNRWNVTLNISQETSDLVKTVKPGLHYKWTTIYYVFRAGPFVNGIDPNGKSESQVFQLDKTRTPLRLGPFSFVGTTTNSYYVDRWITTGRYYYFAIQGGSWNYNNPPDSGWDGQQLEHPPACPRIQS